MKRLLVFICLLFFFNAFAQNDKKYSLHGIVLDSLGQKPLEFATITLFPKGIKKPITASITDAAGAFKIDDAKEGLFRVMIESTSNTLALRKQFWKKKGSLALTANNFASKYVNQKTKLYGPGYDAISRRQIPYRSIGLNFTWKFGKLEFKKEDNNESMPQSAE